MYIFRALDKHYILSPKGIKLPFHTIEKHLKFFILQYFSCIQNITFFSVAKMIEWAEL